MSSSLAEIAAEMHRCADLLTADAQRTTEQNRTRAKAGTTRAWASRIARRAEEGQPR